MDEKRNKRPAENINTFMADPENVLIVSDMLGETLEFLRKGKGKYSPDGSFDSKEATLGASIVNPTPGHRKIDLPPL